jgi:CubicO group peptidase (beta-lactamase class C family)
MKRIVVSVLAAVLCAALATSASEPMSSSQDALDSLVEAAMKHWKVPGLAVVVVTDDEVILKGYGTRVHGESASIDADTLLQIASNSKTFCAYAIGMLVDDGKLGWRDPVKKHIPEFRVPDPYVTENITIEDLLCHRSGLTPTVPGGFNNPDYKIQNLLGDIKDLELAGDFRSRNIYSQVGMALLGEIVLRASGTSWEDFVRVRLFKPLGMESSYTSNADFSQRVGKPSDAPNIMQPALKKDGVVVNGSWDGVGSERLYAPAGGVISTMRDIARWISFRLNDGVLAGKRLISVDSLEEIRAPRIPLDFSYLNMPFTYIKPDAQLIDAGFGQYSFEHRGRKVIVHNGGWMNSVIEIMPGEDIGVGVFTNAMFNEPAPWASVAFVNAVALDIFDHFLGYDDTDWSKLMLEAVADN